MWLSAPLMRVNRADPLGVTGWSGTAVTHAYTPVPARTRDPFRHIWLRAPHFRHLCPIGGRAAHAHARTRVHAAPMSQYPVCPSSSITIRAGRPHPRNAPSLRVQLFFLLFLFVCTIPKCSKIQRTNISVLSGLTWITLSQACRKVRG